ncbi:MAG TPA: molybdopterin-dependent oxidoreductase [Nevskiaceae bacterium]|nr:molybdopterin-dependent oxidoreductase [Nevskiaceae bacterium]
MKTNRRHFLWSAGAVGALWLGSAASRARAGWLTNVLGVEENVNQAVQRAIVPTHARAPQYTRADISAHFKSNGTHDPTNPEYQALAKNHFVDWRLEINGLIDHPVRLSLAQLRALPGVTQITRHDCVEGWSCIGEWTGVPLMHVLAPLGIQRRARYVMFFCYDRPGSADGVAGVTENYYESIDLVEAAHPDTLLAYGMNGHALPIPYGAPLRLRLGRQLGYKMPKYLRRITLVEEFHDINGGHGGFYEDHGYEWYAGI